MGTKTLARPKERQCRLKNAKNQTRWSKFTFLKQKKPRIGGFLKGSERKQHEIDKIKGNKLLPYAIKNLRLQ
ncbi:hypothetical protein [Enterobacter sp.]|uniref:hypothetical protein n=1 Tax=Enterobacter sp. TaxID=42895 RepID=UPI00296E62AB|nr:hypothetical protein [Enterobacter sp.]